MTACQELAKKIKKSVSQLQYSSQNYVLLSEPREVGSPPGGPCGLTVGDETPRLWRPSA